MSDNVPKQLSNVSPELANQPHNLPMAMTKATCSGCTYIVTGSNTGLGFEAAQHLVALGSTKVIMAVRNLDAGEAAKAKIEATTGKTNIAEVWVLDMANYDSVKAFAKKATTDLDRIDALIENAGAAGGSDRVMAEGHLMAITVNLISTLLLAFLMLPKLSQSAQKFGTLPHLAIITSCNWIEYEEIWNKIKEDPLAKLDEENCEPALRRSFYPMSKLLLTFAFLHIAPSLPVSKTGVVMNVINPGFCVTDLARNAPPQMKEAIAKLRKDYGRTAEDGSRTLLHGAVAGRNSHGRLLDSCRIAQDKLPIWVTNEDGIKSQERVWEIVACELDIIEPGCVEKALRG